MGHESKRKERYGFVILTAPWRKTVRRAGLLRGSTRAGQGESGTVAKHLIVIRVGRDRQGWAGGLGLAALSSFSRLWGHRGCPCLSGNWPWGD